MAGISKKKKEGNHGNFGWAPTIYTRATETAPSCTFREKLLFFLPLHICAFSLTDLWSYLHPEAKRSLVSAPAFSFTVRFDFVFFPFSTFPARCHILVMLMTAEPQGAGAVVGTGCTCEGLCRFYQRGSKYQNKRNKGAKTATVYDFINSLQLLWWLGDAEDWHRDRIHASISILAHLLLISCFVLF